MGCESSIQITLYFVFKKIVKHGWKTNYKFNDRLKDLEFKDRLRAVENQTRSHPMFKANQIKSGY